jgi:hypothetical protein
MPTILKSRAIFTLNQKIDFELLREPPAEERASNLMHACATPVAYTFRLLANTQLL